MLNLKATEHPRTPEQPKRFEPRELNFTGLTGQ